MSSGYLTYWFRSIPKVVTFFFFFDPSLWNRNGNIGFPSVSLSICPWINFCIIFVQESYLFHLAVLVLGFRCRLVRLISNSNTFASVFVLYEVHVTLDNTVNVIIFAWWKFLVIFTNCDPPSWKLWQVKFHMLHTTWMDKFAEITPSWNANITISQKFPLVKITRFTIPSAILIIKCLSCGNIYCYVML